MRGFFARLWAWFMGLGWWQRALVVAAVALAVLKAWDLAAMVGSLALDVDALSGRAKRAAVGFRAARRRADAVGRTADAAGSLLDAVSDLGAQHAESDAEADADLAGLDERERAAAERERAAELAVAEARHAKAPEDPTEPQRSRYLGER